MFRWKKRRNKPRIRLSVSLAFVVLLLLFALIVRQRLLPQILLAAGLHECGHFLALRLFGGEIDALRLTVFGAEMRIRHSERLSYGRELAAVLAGPAVNLFCALLLGRMAVVMDWERGYMLSGIHMLLALFNLLPMRALDGGRALYLFLSWCIEPVTAERMMHIVSGAVLCGMLFLGAALQGAVGLQLPLLMLELWFVVCWCMETGIVKPLRTG